MPPMGRTQKKNIDSIKLSSIWLAGDGQYDSPGFCAKYCTYSIMDINTGKIIDFKLVQKGQFKGDLERQACEQLLMDLTNRSNCKIELFLTDRHKGIRAFIRIQHPDCKHEFDIWHLSKSLMKRLKPLEKKYPDAFYGNRQLTIIFGGQHRHVKEMKKNSLINLHLY